jgi:hypothetical protein
MRSFVHSSIDLVSAGGLGEDGLPAGQGTVVGSVFVFVQSIVGAGLLTYPSAYKNSGIGSILLLQGLLMGAIVSGLRYLAFAAHISHADTYQRMMRNIGGARLERACESCVVLVCFGACVAYLDIIIDQVRPLVLALAGESDAAANVGWYGARSIIAVFAAVATFALCLIRNISGLSFPSMVRAPRGSLCGFALLVYLTRLCIAAAITVRRHRHGVRHGSARLDTFRAERPFAQQQRLASQAGLVPLESAGLDQRAACNLLLLSRPHLCNPAVRRDAPPNALKV